MNENKREADPVILDIINLLAKHGVLYEEVTSVFGCVQAVLMQAHQKVTPMDSIPESIML